MIYMHQLEGKC